MTNLTPPASGLRRPFHSNRCKRSASALLGLLLPLLACAGLSRAADLYVAPGGNDGWSGTTASVNAAKADGPLATLEGARNKLRQNKPKGPTKVWIADGTYTLAKAFTLEPQDSGTPAAPISYEAAPGAHPVFTGGRPITPWKGPDARGAWTAQIPDVATWRFEQLWVNGHFATRARTPNRFYLYPSGPVRPTTENGNPETLQNRAIKSQKEIIQPLSALSPTELNDVVVTAFLNWTSTQYRVQHLDVPANTIYFTDEQWGAWRYQVENYAAALDAPGEWFLDRRGTVSYIPREGEDMTKAQVAAPVLEHLLELNGNAAEGHFVENLTLRGLSFQHAAFILPPEGFHDGQGEVRITAAVVGEGARNVTFENCEIAHGGAAGIWLHQGSRDDRILHCTIHDFGAGGVKIGDGKAPTDAALQTSHITLDNSILHHLGWINRGADGVWIGHSGDNTITHNDVGDLYESGISVGWVWGFTPDSLAKRNTIAFNHVHHLGQGVLSDIGGVYTLGVSEGTTVTNNVIHDVQSYSYGGWGLYMDEGSRYIKLENNLVYDTRSGSLISHLAQDNAVRNNILAFGKYGPPNPVANSDYANGPEGQLQRISGEDYFALNFDNNVVYWDEGMLFKGDWSKNVKLRHNVFWDASKQAAPDVKGYAGWKAFGVDEGSVLADPKFVNPAARDFRLQPDSPALALGFKPFDPAQAGVYGDKEWVALAKNDPMPALKLMPNGPPPGPWGVNEDFESMVLGVAPEYATQFVEHRGDSIGASEDTAAGGKRSLKVVDAPNLTNRFDPHWFLQPNHHEGMSHASFDVRVDAGAVFLHEWRDGGKPYQTGPAILILEGRLESNGKKLLDVPVAQWLHIDITVGLGQKANGKWNLAVTLPDKSVRRFDGLDCASPGFAALDWYGFINDSNAATVYYLDNLKLTNDQTPAPPP